VNFSAAALHLLNFVLPALAVAAAMAVAGRFLKLKRPIVGDWKARTALIFVAGVATLGVGLYAFDVDGKMATYSALVLVGASLQWLLQGGWRK
jgi:hypothetical protein